MNEYHVTYYYLATGMEGRADTYDHGIVYAESEQEAVNYVGWRRDPKERNETYRNWGLQAKLVSAKADTKEHLLAIINELNEIEKPMNQALHSQELFASAIRAKQYIVGSVCSEGTLSFSGNPVPHAGRALARAECSRLAKINPGKLYVFVCFEGAEMLPKPTATISI